MAYEDELPDAPELVVFDTLVPREHPGNLRRFRLPPKYSGRGARVDLDLDRSLGTVNRDGHLIVDPTQAVFIINLAAPIVLGLQILLILRIQPMIEHARSMRADTHIPWDEWGSGAVAMEISIESGRFDTIIHGTRLLMVHDTYRILAGERYRIHTFDFSRRGSAALPLSDGDGKERAAVFKDGPSCTLKGDGVNPWGLRSLGDSIPYSIVSLFFSSVEGDVS